MLKKLSIPLLFLLFGYFIISDENLKVIFSGIAIFIIGMNFMEDGFKLFSGGALEKLLEKFTNNLYKAIFTGFFTTSIVQSSSLISVITISFLSVNLITLTQGIGIIFGSNLGSTTTAWLVTIFGLKLKISSFAMPMIIFGVVFKFLKFRLYRGFGNILLGLGFIFLGIAYMKDGFETLKSAIDLASYFIDGYLGILIYIFIGFLATIIIQSSSATIAIVITALATGQIFYESALALAIGANVGTTVTAILGSMASNENGKRLAYAHFIFNITTATIAAGFIYQLSDFVNILGEFFKIDPANYTLKLAIFHTTFNILGVLLVSPFVGIIEKSSRSLFKSKVKSTAKPKYISDTVIDVPNSALISLEKEILNLYNKAQKAILHALSLHKHDVIKSKNLKKTIRKSTTKIETNIDEIYRVNLKSLYTEIIRFSSLSQKYMNQKQSKRVYKLKIASKEIITCVKEIRRLQKNTTHFLNARKEEVQEEYNMLRQELANVLKEIYALSQEELSLLQKQDKVQELKQRIKKLDIISSGKIDKLIREDKINPKMATSLINDSATAYHICKKLIEIAVILFIHTQETKEEEEDIL